MSSLKKYEARKERRDSAANWTSNNPTPLEGEWCLETDTDNWKVGDGSTAWNSLDYTGNPIAVYDISSANQTMTLPKVTGTGQTYDFFWSGGDGTYTATLAVTNSETVGGITAATWTGEGEGNISCVSDGTNWQVKAYDDYADISDSGVNVDRLYCKNKFGEMRISGKYDDTIAVSTTNGSLYKSATTSCAFGKTFIATPGITTGHMLTSDSEWHTSSVVTTTGFGIKILDVASRAATNYKVGWNAVGRWRT